MSDSALEAIRTVVQRDLGGRGLDRDPQANLFARCAGDFAEACRSLARHPSSELAVITGFWIATAGRFETDGPPGAVFLTRVLEKLGIRVRLYTDAAALDILRAGFPEATVAEIPTALPTTVSHLLALERVGPGHTLETLRDPEEIPLFVHEVPESERGRCRSMRGIDITQQTTPSEHLFLSPRGYVTIGIGDGGNEIGMGKVPWSMIHRAIPRGGSIACRVPTDHLLVAGVSNWGAYALAAGVAVLRGQRLRSLFDPIREEESLRRMVEAGLIDGVSGKQTATVDGLPFAVHAEVLTRLGRIVGG